MLSMLLFSLLTVAVPTGAMVIQSRWSHIRFKALPPARVDGREGGEVVLFCSVTGSPTPRVAWYKDSLFVSHLDWSVQEDVTSIGESLARLTIPCFSQSDVGTYECRARSGENEVSMTTEVNMTPTDPSTSSAVLNSDSAASAVASRCIASGRPSISMWRGTYMLEEGGTASLPCRVQGDVQDYRVTWTNAEGVEPAHANDVRFSVESNGDLVIRDVQFTDMGQYSCSVSGFGGTDTIHTFLYPLSAGRNLADS